MRTKTKTKHKPIKKKTKETLAQQYIRFFEPEDQQPATTNLQQPSLYKIVKTVTTYGAYEDPI